MSEAFLNIYSLTKNVWEMAFTTSGICWTLATILLFGVSLKLYRRSHYSPLLHPLIVTTLIREGLLLLMEVPVPTYQQHAGIIHWLLGPATVALAIPVHAQWHKLKNLGWPLIASIGTGGIIAPLAAWLALYLGDAPLALHIAMLCKSITTPLAMTTAQAIGGAPALAAVFVVITGIVGAVTSPFLFRWLKIHSVEAQGVALGTVAHAIGTARALQINEPTAAIASLSLCTNGIMTAVILPVLFIS